MKLLKLIFISITLFTLTAYAGEDAAQDTTQSPLRAGIKWGMTPAQVREREADSPFLTLLESESYADRLYYIFKQDDETASIVYKFVANGVTSMQVDIPFQPEDLEKYIVTYIEIANKTIDRYGQPNEVYPASMDSLNKDYLLGLLSEQRSGLSITWYLEASHSRFQLLLNREVAASTYHITSTANTTQITGTTGPTQPYTRNRKIPLTTIILVILFVLMVVEAWHRMRKKGTHESSTLLRNGITWGMTPQQVEELETAEKDDSFTPDKDSGGSMLSYALSEGPAEYELYWFNNNRLTSIAEFTEFHDVHTDFCIDIYNKTRESMISEYGQPLPTEAETESDEPEFLSIWEPPNTGTRIELSLAANDDGLYILTTLYEPL